MIRPAAAMIAVTLIVPFLAAEDGARTTNLRITTRWVDADRVRVRRENDGGEVETVLVNAVDGTTMVVESSGNDDASGFQGGPVPKSSPNGDATTLNVLNLADQPVRLVWVDGGGTRHRYHELATGETYRQSTYIGHVWEAVGEDETFYGSVVAIGGDATVAIEQTFPRPSPPQEKTEPGPRRKNAVGERVRTHRGRLQFRAADPDASWREIPIDGIETTGDGSEPGDVVLERAEFSPDDAVVGVWVRTVAGREKVATIESSPDAGGRAVLRQRPYLLPGDKMDSYRWIALDANTQQRLPVDVPEIDFGRPGITWRAGHEAIIRKVDRGHQRLRLFVIDPVAGQVRVPIDETGDTFIWTSHGPPIRPITFLPGGNEVIHASEKDGYRHLYLVDLEGEREPRAITGGDFVCRELLHVDPENRTLDVVVGEYHDEQDPYHRHLIRVGIDDGNVTTITDGDGDHEFEFSPDRRYVIARRSRVDCPPVHELRRTSDGALISTLASALRIAGDDGKLPALPTRFVAKGRDGVTDIHGLICFPPGFADARERAYPVIEAIYAGPHDSHVPKRYRNSPWYDEWTSLGFVVVKIDGMGTANRSKAFHDVCWQNLRDAGFPDRIAWIKAAADEYPAMDISRVGVFGTSAGGQNACGALLFHGEFYDAAVAACGCHDNRMDKASWNEQWMGYPVGPHYAANSNIDNAEKLDGDLLLIVGELDRNVPPESTLRLVDALIKADKRFELLVVPGMGHSDGGVYGRKLTREFFVRKLKPDRGNEASPSDATEPPSAGQVTAADLESLPATKFDELAASLYRADRDLLKRRHPIRIAKSRITHMTRFLDAWEIADVASLAESLSTDRAALRRDAATAKAMTEAFPFLPGLLRIINVSDRGRKQDFAAIATEIAKIEAELKAPDEVSEARINTPVGEAAREVANAFASWQTFHADYHPEFGWWVGDLATRLAEKLKRWRPSDAAQEKLVTMAAGIEPWDVSVDETLPPMFDNSYPHLDRLRTEVGTRMPAIMRRYRQDLRAAKDDRVEVLRAWRTAVEAMQLGGQPYERWDAADQVDYHRLREQIRYQIARGEIADREPIISRAADGSGIEGKVVGRERLELELRRELIDHSPEELIALAESEYRQCRLDLIATAREMGLGDDWKAAVERIKTLHVEVGRQPELIRQTAEESVDWLRDHDWLTVDRWAERSWRMKMMTPERQRVTAFFTGGEEISVSFPTRQMTPQQKRQSLRSNNPPYARATVHHELIPGHHLQGFSAARYRTHRRAFGTPFWLEGWAVYWEFVLLADGFARTPEERMGFLVWRAHRYARIIFSLNFHLGRWTPDQCVQFLIDNVGFERRSAEAEVRRSVGPDYPPLYQAAYMLGAMQLRELARRWVDEKRGGLKSFHDAVIRQSPLPIALLEATLMNSTLNRNQPPLWKF